MAEKKQNKPKIGIGYRVGKLTVEEATPQRRSGYTVWCCRCDFWIPGICSEEP